LSLENPYAGRGFFYWCWSVSDLGAQPQDTEVGLWIGFIDGVSVRRPGNQPQVTEVGLGLTFFIEGTDRHYLIALQASIIAHRATKNTFVPIFLGTKA
jgi:hypothetical protein